MAGEDGILLATAEGYQRVDSSERILERVRSYREQRRSRFLGCLDARECTGVEPEARKLMGDNLLRGDTPFRAFAVVGGNVFTRTLFNMYAKISRIPMRVFSDRSSAIAWLLQR